MRDWLVLQPNEPPCAVPLLWCVAQRVRGALQAARVATLQAQKDVVPWISPRFVGFLLKLKKKKEMKRRC